MADFSARGNRQSGPLVTRHIGGAHCVEALSTLQRRSQNSHQVSVACILFCTHERTSASRTNETHGDDVASFGTAELAVFLIAAQTPRERGEQRCRGSLTATPCVSEFPALSARWAVLQAASFGLCPPCLLCKTVLPGGDGELI